MRPTTSLWLRLVGAALIILLAVAACAPRPEPGTGADTTPAASEEHSDGEEHEEGEEHQEGDDHSHDRIPNDGAVIRITAPEDGATITGGEVVVEVETENFALGEGDRHWHIYVDGASLGMVEGGVTEFVVRGLDPGEHEISAYLASGEHEELEDGSTVMITVSE
jgi:hypothetical protein